MPGKNDCWGLEVGANAIKAIRLVREDDEVQVAAYDVLPFKKILTTPDLDVDEAIQVNLDAFLARHNIGRSTVVASVPGHMAFSRFTKLPPVDPKKIPEVVTFEAQQQIPFRMDQVEWDYQTFSQPDTPDVEVGLFAITKERISQFLSNFHAVGLRVDAVTLSPLALYNAIGYDLDLSPESPGTVLMDIGTQATDVVIVEQGSVWSRTLPIGGNDFTEALVKSFKLSFRKAEKLKREAGTSKYARQVFQAMRPVFSDLVQELQKTLGYYRSLHRDSSLERFYGFGSTFRLPGLQKFLKQQLQMDVQRLKFQKISVEGKQSADFNENALNLGTAYGLALQGLDMEKVDANLLPRPLVKQRVWRAKQPWFVAAAVLLASAVALAGLRYWADKQSFESTHGPTQREVQPILEKAQSLARELEQVEGGDDPRQRIENLRRILDYRDVWPKVMHDLSLATGAMNPQSVLLEPSYADWRGIDRTNWRRIFIEDLEAEFTLDKSDDGGDQEVYQDPTAIWGKQRAAGTPEKQEETETTPPSFVLRISGTTPYRPAPRFLSETLIQWLKDKAARKGHPYEIKVDDPLVKLRPLGNVGEAEEEERPDRSRRGRRGRRRTGRDTGSEAPQQKSLAELFPERPKVSLPKPGSDYAFTIEWTVRLVRPSKVRELVEEDLGAEGSGAGEEESS